MNRFPHEPLDAEERRLAARLPRLHGRSEPDAALDARILAAAQAGTRPAKPMPPRRSWIVPLSVAASLTLAVGLAWRLQPLPAPDSGAEASVAAQPASEEPVLRAITAPAPPSAMTEPAPQVVKPMPMPAARARIASTNPAPAPATERAAMPVADAAPPAPPPPPPPAPTAAPAPAPIPAPVVAEQAAAAPSAFPAPQTAAQPRALAAMAKTARSTEAAREPAAASGVPAMKSRNEAQMAEDATLDTMAADQLDEDVPPATANSPEVRNAWLKRITELLKQGKADEARDSLSEFRRRYPDAVLPPELQALEKP